MSVSTRQSRAAPATPSAESLALIDQTTRRIHADAPGLEAWTGNYLAQHRERFATDIDLIGAAVPLGASLLDVGAAPYATSAALQARGYALAAVDIEPDRFAGLIGELELEVRRCDVEREPLPFGDAGFDAVLFNEMFEHLRIDPIFTLGEVHRVLKPGGKLLLSTPNLRSLRGLRNLLLHDQGHAVSGGIYRQYEKLRTLGHMGHVREYTVTETCEFLGQLGFVVETVVFRGGHGRGVVGAVERLAPSLRPFFSVIARREGQGGAAGE